MPVKTHKQSTKKHPKHYAKVYWPYLPLVLVMGVALWLAYPAVSRSQQGVLSYSNSINNGSLLDATNQQRRKDQKSELTNNPLLTKAAQAKAEDMVKRNYWSHNTPDGQAPWVFVESTGYQFQSVAENLAYGFDDSSETIKGWLNSPSHRENLLSNDYQEVGFGIVESSNYLGKGPETIVVAIYGKPGNAMPSQVLSETTNNEAKSISKAQALTAGKTPWISFAVGLLAGAGIVYLLVKNSVAVHRAIKKGEKFIHKHPVWDVTILALIVLCVLLSQSIGTIL